MELLPSADLRTVHVFMADTLYADALQHVIRRALPKARVRLSQTVASATQALAPAPADLLIVGVGASTGSDVLDWLSGITGPAANAHSVMVVTTEHQARELAFLRKIPFCSVFDSTHESSAQFEAALKLVATGAVYWSQGLLDILRDYAAEPFTFPRLLTLGEELVLCLIGDGSDDADAARELGLSASTITTVRRNLHRKLGVQHRGALVRVAALNGFVRFTGAGVVRPGYATLLATWRQRRHKPLVEAAA